MPMQKKRNEFKKIIGSFVKTIGMGIVLESTWSVS